MGEKSIIQNIPIGIAVISIEKPFKIVEANDEFYSMYGFDNSLDFESDNIMIVTEQYEKVLEEMLHNCFSQCKNGQAEVKIPHKSGFEKWTLMRCNMDEKDRENRQAHIVCLDINEKKQIESELYFLGRQYDVMEEVSEGNPFDYDVSNKKIFISFDNNIKGRKLNEELYLDFSETLKKIHPIDRNVFENEMLKASLNEMSGSVDFRYNISEENKKPKYLWYRILYRSVLDINGKIARVIGRCRNVESDMALKDKVRRDPLTKLFNKVEIKTIVEDILVKEPNATHVLFVIDIDNFKSINDTFGHTFGDTVISDIAHILKEHFRGDDVVGRVGGDEFLVLMRNISVEIAVNKAKRLCKILKREYTGGDVVRHTSASIGIAVSGVDGNTYDELFEKADHAMYRAKKDGKDGFRIAMEDDKGPIHHKDNTNEKRSEIEERDKDFLAFALNILSHARNIDASLNLLLEKILSQYNLDLITVSEQNNKDDEIILTNYAGKNISMYEKTVFPKMGISDKLPEVGMAKCLDGINVSSYLDIFEKQGIEVDKDFLANVHMVAGKFEYIGNRHGICCFCSFEKDKKWTESEILILGELSRTIGVFASLRSRIEQSNADIRKIQNKDQLTGLLTLDVFKGEFRKAVEDNCNHKKLCLCYFDINNFGYINENYGYQIGDKILRVLSRDIEESDNVILSCRLYSDFFIMLLGGEDKESIVRYINKKHKEFVNQNNHQYPNCGLALTTGLYFIDDEKIDVDVAIENVNLAWKKAKRNRSTKVVVFEEKFRKERGEEQQVVGEFYESLYKGDFLPYFQPKFNLVTNEIYGAEALARWKRADGKIVPPIKFIDSLEKIGYITDLDFCIFEETLKTMLEWKKQGLRSIVVSVNFSGKHFEADSNDFMKRINQLMKRYPVEPSNLEIEITEGVMVKNYESLVKSLGELREKGFRVAVDDFGTGFSSLSILTDIPADVVKMDKSFLDKEISQKNIAVLKSIGDLVNTTGREIVFEGVETEEQRRVLVECGFSYGQGFLCNRPIPSEEFKKLYL